MMITVVNSEQAMREIGRRLGGLLVGGEVIELIGDVGAGKTTFTKGLAEGLAVSDDVQSPSFTISRVYEARDGLLLAHYDFYRLNDAGIMAMELAEAISDNSTVTVVEWADVVGDILPLERLTIRITSPSENDRQLEIIGAGDVGKRLMESLA